MRVLMAVFAITLAQHAAADSFTLDGFVAGKFVNATGRQWGTTRWTTVNSAHVSPEQSAVNNQTTIVDNTVYLTSPYSAHVTGNWTSNGPTTYSGFALTAELGPTYTNLTWMQSVTFSVRASTACTLRFNVNYSKVSYYPVTWNGQWFDGGGNDDQYGYTFTIGTANTWQTIGIDYTNLTCQDWGQNSCPLTLSDGTTMSLSRALSNVSSLQWQTEGNPATLGFWIDQVVLTAKSGYSAPTTFKANKSASPFVWSSWMHTKF